MKVEDGVKITVKASAWSGSPSSLNRYVTPLYVEIQNNNSDKTLTFNYEDLVLFSENRTQYNPLPPGVVADILQAKYGSRYAYRPFYPSFSIGIGSGFYFGRRFFSPFGYYSPFNYYGYDPFWYPPAYSYRPVDTEDVFTQALIPGSVYPNARLEGFVYFKKLPEQVERVTFEISYSVRGEQDRHKFSFPFAVEESS